MTRKFLSLILLGLIQFFLATIAFAADSTVKEDFYWKNSYTRDAGLCYPACRTGYKGVGPVCWQEEASYGRGVGTIPSLRSGCGDKEKDAGLCYPVCRTGYKGVGPVCYRNGADSYGRGAGTPLISVCETGKEADAGLCYQTCKADYKGIGPVCWGNTPTGYVDCAAGFAKDKTTCATVTGNQVAAVGIFVGTTVVPEARAAIKAGKAAEEAEKAKSVFDALKPMTKKMEEVFSKLKKGVAGDGTMIGDLRNAWKELSEADKLKLKLAVKLALAGKSVADGQVNEIDLLRDAANIASILDPTGLLSVAAAYTYPVYGVDYN
jgi:hypothetical protein